MKMKNRIEESTDNVRSEISGQCPQDLQYRLSVNQLRCSTTISLNNFDEKSRVNNEDFGSKQAVVDDTNREFEQTNVIIKKNAQNRIHDDKNDCISKDMSHKDVTNKRIKQKPCQCVVSKRALKHDYQKRPPSKSEKQSSNKMEKQDAEKDVDGFDIRKLKDDKDSSQNDEKRIFEKVKGLIVQKHLKEDKKNQADERKLKHSSNEGKIPDEVDNKEHDYRSIRSTCDEETSPKSGVDPDLEQNLKVDIPEKEENEIAEAVSLDESEFEGAIEHSWSSECDTPGFTRMTSIESAQSREDGAEFGNREEIRPNDLDLKNELKLLNSFAAEIGNDCLNVILKEIKQILEGNNQCTTCGLGYLVGKLKQYLSGHQPCNERTFIRSDGNLEKPHFAGKNQDESTVSDNQAGSKELQEEEAQTDRQIEDLENKENEMIEDKDNEGEKEKYIEQDKNETQTTTEKQADREVNLTNLASKEEQTVGDDQIKEEKIEGRVEEENIEEVEKFETETKEKKEDQEKDTDNDVHDKSAVDQPSLELSGKSNTMEEQDRNNFDILEAEEENDLQPSNEKNKFEDGKMEKLNVISKLNDGKMDKFLDYSANTPISATNKKRKRSKRRRVNYEKQKFELKLAESSEDHKDIPKINGRCRRVKMLQPGSNGRRCSDSGSNSAGAPNGKKGSKEGDDKQGRENKKGSKDQPERNSEHGKDREDRNNPNEDDSGNNDDSNSESSIEPRRRLSEDSKPQPNSKRVRKKHSNISSEHWEKFLGYLKQQAEARGCPCWDLLHQNPVADCLANCMENVDDLTDDMLTCFVCSTINSLMKHYANCSHVYMACSLCTQIFSLICCHVNQCIQTSNNFNKRVDMSISICEIPLCDKIRLTLSGAEISGPLKMLWFNIRKKLSRVMGDTELYDERRSSITVAPTLESIKEDEPITSISNSRPGSRILSRKKSRLSSVGEGEEPSGNSDNGGEANASSIKFDQTTVDEGIKDIKILKDRHSSLPIGPPKASEGQFISFIDRPVGIKGIGEVVYADKNQLVVVARHWDTKKKDFLENGKLPKHSREEGVILEKYKDMLIIGTTRYQKEFQWVRVSHLGNGITGRCYLATDFETEAKFCVKEIHISNYEMEEISLWAELDHPYIVKIYGAIRLGEKIFIFMEYIAGGCLTEAINHQRRLGQRLSQKTALRYFQQLLQVLCYLKYKNVLNEDLKGDNMLLHKEGRNVSIKVTDFGAARRCQGQIRKGTKPMGTQTQWSPEKAEATGYGFPAEVWAAVCVLVHMLSGSPPWIRRFGTIKTLIVVIVNHSPPIEDIPRNISDSVRDLIERGFTVCPGTRPTAEALLLHPAFSLLEDGVTTEAYSILPIAYHDNADIEDEHNKDLKEIYRKLSDTPSGLKSSHIVPQNSVVPVYTALNSAIQGSNVAQGQQNGAADNVANQASGVINQGEYATNQRVVAVSEENGEKNQGDCTHISLGLEVPGASGYQSNINDSPRSNEMKATKPSPSDPYENMDYTKHFMSYLHDTSPPRFPEEPVNELIEYNPDIQTLHEQPVEPLPDLSFEEVFNRLIPNFNMLWQSEDFEAEGNDEEDIFKNFNLREALKQMNLSAIDDTDPEEEKSKATKAGEEKYNVESLASDRSPHTIKNSERTTHSSTDSKMMAHAINDNATSTPAIPVQNKNDATSSANTLTFRQGYQPSQEKTLDSFNDDDLFVSGSPKNAHAFDLCTTKNQPQPSFLERFNQSSMDVQGLQNPTSSLHKNSPTSSHSHMAHLTGSRPLEESRSPILSYTPTQHADLPMSYNQSRPTFHHPQQRFEPPDYDPYGMPQTQQSPHFQYIRQPHSLNQTLIKQPEGTLTGSSQAQGQEQTLLRSSQNLFYTPHGYRYDQSQRRQPENIHTTDLSQTSRQNEIQQPQMVRFRQHNPQRMQYDNQHGQRYFVQKENQYPTLQAVPISQPHSFTGNHHGQGRYSTPGTSTRYQIQHTLGTSMPGFPQQVPNTYFRFQQQMPTYVNQQTESFVPEQIIIPPSSNQQGGKQNHLQLDVQKAKQGKSIPSTCSQTAPVSSPTKAPNLTSPPYNRTASYAPPPPQRPSLSISSPGSKSMTSKSQYEEQERALIEFRDTAKDALSQHDGSVIDFDEDEDLEGEVHAEFDVSVELTADDMKSMTAYFQDDKTVSESRIEVVFKRRGDSKSEGIKMSFPKESRGLLWETIIDEELSRHANEISDGLKIFCLKLEDGTLVDLDSCLGDENVVVYVEPADEKDWWWVEGGVIMKSAHRN